MCMPLSTLTLYLKCIYHIQLVMNSKWKAIWHQMKKGLDVNIYSWLLCLDRMLFLQLFGDVKSFYKRSFGDYIQQEIPSISPRDVESLNEVSIYDVHEANVCYENSFPVEWLFVFSYSWYLIIWSSCILMLVLHNDFVSPCRYFPYLTWMVIMCWRGMN